MEIVIYVFVGLILIGWIIKIIQKISDSGKKRAIRTEKTGIPELDIEITPEEMLVDCPSSEDEIDLLFKEKKVDDVFTDVIKKLFPIPSENSPLVKYHKTQVKRYVYRVEEYGDKLDLMNLGRHDFLVGALENKKISYDRYLVFGVYYDLFYDLIDFYESYMNDPIAIEELISDM